MRQFLTIAANAFMELIRQPVFLLLMTGSVLFELFLAVPYYFAFGDEPKLVENSVLAVMLLAGLFGAVLSASSSLAREIRTGTALAVLSKPVGRAQFLLAKFAGLALALFLALGGGTAWAAHHYLITSTSQIKPSVRNSLRGHRGYRGYRGYTGKNGTNGTNGAKGATGATGATGAAGAAGAAGATSVTEQSVALSWWEWAILVLVVLSPMIGYLGRVRWRRRYCRDLPGRPAPCHRHRCDAHRLGGLLDDQR